MKLASISEVRRRKSPQGLNRPPVLGNFFHPSRPALSQHIVGLRNPQFLLFLLRFHDLCNWLRLYRYKFRPKCCTAPTNRPKNRAIRLRSKQKRDCCRKRQQTRLNHTDKFEFGWLNRKHYGYYTHPHSHHLAGVVDTRLGDSISPEPFSHSYAQLRSPV